MKHAALDILGTMLVMNGAGEAQQSTRCIAAFMQGTGNLSVNATVVAGVER